MLIPTIIMGIAAVILLIIGYKKGDGAHITGVKSAMIMTMQIFPLLVFAFIIAGMAQILIPAELLAKWVGKESGMKGIFFGAIAGSLTPGGPFVSLPITAGLLRGGASIGTSVAYLTGWSLWNIIRIPLEVGIMGWNFTIIRIASTIVFPPIAGFIAQVFFGAGK